MALKLAPKTLGTQTRRKHSFDASPAMAEQPEVEGDYLFKLLLVVRWRAAISAVSPISQGDSGVGKSSILLRYAALASRDCLTSNSFTEDEFEEGGLGATIGTSLHRGFH